MTLALRGRTAVVAASPTKAARLARDLAALGARVFELPAIEIRRVADTAAMDAAADRLAEYDWVLFTSVHGVEHFVGRMRERGLGLERWLDRSVGAVGPATARALEELGIAVGFVPTEFMAEGVLSALAAAHGSLQALSGRRILLPRAREGRQLVPDALAAAGARVDVVACYENLLPDLGSADVRQVLDSRPDLIVFTSSSAVHNFLQLAGDEVGRTLLREATVAAIGPITARTLADLGKQPEIVPASHTLPALVEAIVSHFTRQ